LAAKQDSSAALGMTGAPLIISTEKRYNAAQTQKRKELYCSLRFCFARIA
jgi:hypothetical protein